MNQRPNPGLRHAAAAPLAGLLALAALLATVAHPAAAAVKISVQPAMTNVATGAEFDVTLHHTPAGSAFNGFVAVVGYDPAALTFVPLANTANQQGCLMTGTCSGACGNTFHRFEAAGDSLTITNHLLCNQVVITQPGTLYKLRFRASTTPQATWIRIRRATFYDAGLYVTPVGITDAQVGIGVVLDAGGAGAPAAGLRVRAEPNPSRGRLSLAIDSDRAGERRIEVYDPAGRLVRRLDGGRHGPGLSRVPWDGTDLSGARVRPGVYLVTVLAGDRVARTRIAVLE